MAPVPFADDQADAVRFFICTSCTVLAIDREFWHPLFRNFTAHEYGEVGQILAVTEDVQGRMLVGCRNAVVAFDSGVFLLNQEGHLVANFTINTGLADAGFETTGEDRDGGLWICADTEITRIQCGGGCTKFDHEVGLPKGFISG